MKESSDNNWISFSDIMTVLMIIFLFISISYMMQVRKEQAQQDKIFKSCKKTRSQIYNDLDSTFSKGFEKWNIEIEPDLSIKISNANALFEAQLYTDEVILKEDFKDFLSKFSPRFLTIILNPKYQDKISEIRIEGHTSIRKPIDEFSSKYYQHMVVLSQKRSNKVLEHMMSLSSYTNLTDLDKKRLRFFLTSNGLAFGRSLDGDNNYKFYSNKNIDKKKSMRVEFKIVTNSQDVINKWFENFKK